MQDGFNYVDCDNDDCVKACKEGDSCESEYSFCPPSASGNNTGKYLRCEFGKWTHNSDDYGAGEDGSY